MNFINESEKSLKEISDNLRYLKEKIKELSLIYANDNGDWKHEDGEYRKIANFKTFIGLSSEMLCDAVKCAKKMIENEESKDVEKEVKKIFGELK